MWSARMLKIVERAMRLKNRAALLGVYLCLDAFQIEFASKMAGYEMIWLNLSQVRRLLLTDILGIAAAGMEIASTGWVGWVSNITLHDDPVFLAGWIGQRER